MKILLKPYCLIFLTCVMEQFFEIFCFWEFPGGPVIKTVRLLPRPRFRPLEELLIRPCKPLGVAKEQEKETFCFSHSLFLLPGSVWSQALCTHSPRRSVCVRFKSRKLLQILPFLDFVFIKPELPESVMQKEKRGEGWKATKGCSTAELPRASQLSPSIHLVSLTRPVKPPESLLCILYSMEQSENHSSRTIIAQIFWVGEQLGMVEWKLRNFRYTDSHVFLL